MSDLFVDESRDIDASAAHIFSIVSDPAMHPDIDGTGMLRSAAENQVMSKVGDVFFMSMTHWDRGNYVMENHVVEFEQDRRIAWEPVAQVSEKGDFDSTDRFAEPRWWGWQLKPLSDDRTRVTEFYECSRLSDRLREFIKNGEFWRPAMVTSLENLERLATKRDGKALEGDQSETASQFAELFQGD
ncbi:MAG TPA: hypothetical protein VIJ99_07655 [Acidimicrobiales bacterium]